MQKSRYLARAGFRGGPRGPGPGPGPGPQASYHGGASHQTAHILFLPNESADDFFIDALLQFARYYVQCTEIAVQEHFAPSPNMTSEGRDLTGGLKIFLGSLSLAIFYALS